jgi:hypothetical protein
MDLQHQKDEVSVSKERNSCKDLYYAILVRKIK